MTTNVVQLTNKAGENIYPVVLEDGKATIEVTDTDPGEGVALQENHFIAVYGDAGKIQTDDLAGGAVTTSKIADGAITSDKIDLTTFALPAAIKYGNADITISASGSYNGQTYTGLNRITTNNSEYFAASTYGITVKKAGLYLVSGYINLDLSNNAVQWRMQGSGITVGTIDIGAQTGMGGFFFPAQIARYSANTNVYPVLAFQNSGSVTSRGGRSYINIVKIG